MTRRRSGESRDDSGRAGRWAAARAGDVRGGAGAAPGCNEGPATTTAATTVRRRHDCDHDDVAGGRRGGDDRGWDVVETTTRSSGDDGSDGSLGPCVLAGDAGTQGGDDATTTTAAMMTTAATSGERQRRLVRRLTEIKGMTAAAMTVLRWAAPPKGWR